MNLPPNQKVEFVLLLTAITWQTQTCAVPLHLESLSHCAFHLAHFFDVDLSESVLRSNDHGQVWTVFNVSRPSSKPPHILLSPNSRRVVNVSLNLRESRICNVHLLVQPDYTRTPFESYADLLSLSAGTPTMWFIFITRDQSHGIYVPWTSRFYGFVLRMFNIQIQNGVVVKQLRYCAPLEEWHELQALTALPIGTLNTCCGSLMGQSLQVFTFSSAKYINACLNHEQRVHVQFGNCNSVTKSALVIGQNVNGSVEHTHTPQPGLWALMLISASFWPVTNNPQWTPVTQGTREVSLLYCEYNKRRIRNDVNWLGVFDRLTWLLLVAGAAMAMFVEGADARQIGRAHV